MFVDPCQISSQAAELCNYKYVVTASTNNSINMSEAPKQFKLFIGPKCLIQEI